MNELLRIIINFGVISNVFKTKHIDIYTILDHLDLFEINLLRYIIYELLRKIYICISYTIYI